MPPIALDKYTANSPVYKASILMILFQRVCTLIQFALRASPNGYKRHIEGLRTASIKGMHITVALQPSMHTSGPLIELFP
jgi:hypothetical protein